MCLLFKVDARPSWSRTANPRPISLQSFLRTKDHCQAGNLLQVHFDGSEPQAKCDGRSPDSLTASKFEQKLYHSVNFLELRCVSLMRKIFASLACVIECMHVHKVEKFTSS